jgi:hypothetical protein
VTSLRHLWRMVTDLFTYSVRTGRWWLPVVVVMLAVAAALVAFVKVAVPTAVYVFF